MAGPRAAAGRNRNRKSGLINLVMDLNRARNLEAPGVGQITRLVSTGLLKLLPALHIRPIKQLVSLLSYPGLRREGGLILGDASRLDAFSAYRCRTWLPSAAPGGTTGTP